MLELPWPKLKSSDKSNKPEPTVCPRSLDPFYIVTYYIKWVNPHGQTVFSSFKH